MSFKWTRPDAYLQHRGSWSVLVGDLQGAGVPIPEPVAHATETVRALESRHASLPLGVDARMDTVTALLADPNAAATKQLRAETDLSVLENALLHSVHEAQGVVQQSVITNSDGLIGGLRSALFEPGVAVLRTVAASNYEDVFEAVKDGAEEVARAMADVEHAGAQVQRAYRLRERILRGADLHQYCCRVFRNRDALDDEKLAGLMGAAFYVEGLRQGGELWLGTISELEAAEREMLERQKAAERDRKAEHDAAYRVERKRLATAS
jgi:hypothetical protein